MQGEEAGGASKTYSIPVWGVRDGKFATHYSRTFVEAAQKLPGVPPISDAHWAALDLLSELADEHCLEMTFERGDVQFINNRVWISGLCRKGSHHTPLRCLLRSASISACFSATFGLSVT